MIVILNHNEIETVSGGFCDDGIAKCFLNVLGVPITAVGVAAIAFGVRMEKMIRNGHSIIEARIWDGMGVAITAVGIGLMSI
jgi:hypothetical protein